MAHEPLRTLPRGPHQLARSVVRASQRGRLIEAMAEAVAKSGYADTTVADVVARAGVSRKTFYEHFADREDCFLAAYDAAVEVLLGESAGQAAAAHEGGWVERVREGVRAFLGVMASEPAFARTFLVEVLAAGPRALERRASVHARFEQLLCSGAALARADHPELPEVPEAVFAALVGGINEVISDRVRAGRTAHLLELEDTIVYFLLSVLAGPRVAAEAVP
jgi:AcrR family transcriptional regulator